ncbi:MAG: hypothetical protein WKG00_38620, partial [Polyangiaceae bacterium]
MTTATAAFTAAPSWDDSIPTTATPSGPPPRQAAPSVIFVPQASARPSATAWRTSSVSAPEAASQATTT